ncbi:MAG: cation-transporting P-type ATPase, partial [Patescibacteria group bacterium]|nr:cation-transporting P-type ATPase [Patescibacteria group bacterium]
MSDTIFWHNLSSKKTIKTLKSNQNSGLANKEVLTRQKKYGLNQLPQPKKFSSLLLLLSQLQSPLICILFLAVAVSFSLGHRIDAIFILIVVLIIAIFFIYRQYILLQSNNELERQVKLKTKELKEINDNLEIKIKDAIQQNSKKDKLLFSQSKMAAMGEMIGNIAHQWR